MRDDTKLVAAGRDPERYSGVVNPPVFRASTILYPNVEAFEAPRQLRGVYYGRGGTPTTFALEDAIAALEGAHGAVLTGSGKTAIAQALMTFLKAGDHLLMVDSAYAPTRQLCDRVLSRFGVETTYYDPLIGAEIERLVRPNTRGDLPGIAGLAHLRGPGRARDRRGRARARCAHDDRQHLGDAPVLQSAGARRRCRHPRRHQVHLRSFRHHDGRRLDRRSAVSAAAPWHAGPRRLHLTGRLLSGAERAAHPVGAPGTAPGERHASGDLAAGQAGGRAGALPRAAGRSRACRCGGGISKEHPGCSAFFSSRAPRKRGMPW